MSETEIWDADVRTPGDLKKVEDELYADAMAKALKVFEQKLQRMADALGATGSDGRRLRRTRRIGMEVTSTFGTARISVLCGQCKTTGGWETPFRDRIFRGRRGALSPSLEWKVATTVCETGAFEKAAKVCGTWGCTLSDDRAMTLIRSVGDACDPKLLPKSCECAAGRDDVLIIMMDGWLARFKEPRWGDRKAPPSERTGWHEVKSATMFRLSQVAEVSKGRRILVTKHIVAMPAETEPVDFGRRVQDEATRMGLDRAAKVYVIMDGGVYLWGIYDDRFRDVAVGQLDYYHASQHLHALAEALYPDDTQKDEREKWVGRLLKNLKVWGPKTLMVAIAEADEREIEDKTRAETVRREAGYFRDHEKHMDYRTARKDGVPIGSGAMESQCSQNQNRFKRRGQFWSKGGFASFVAAYVWYVNDELKYLYRQAS